MPSSQHLRLVRRPVARRAAVVVTAAVLALSWSCTGGPSEPVAPAITFDESPVTATYATAYTVPTDSYAVLFRARYPLETITAGAPTDYARVQAVSRWVRTRWQHNGDNVAVPGDPISILDMAATGKQYRCVEYAVVVAGALQALGMRARVLNLKMADVQTRSSGAGHVVADVWLPDRQSWIMVDGQWDAIPTLAGEPIDAVRFQQALATGRADLGVQTLSSTDARKYFAWVSPYLYYFDYALDQRLGVARQRGGLMLVPIGAPSPTVFQRTGAIGPMTYTSNRAAFYAAP